MQTALYFNDQNGLFKIKVFTKFYIIIFFNGHGVTKQMKSRTY